MNKLIKIYNRLYSFFAYNLFLYANFILLFTFILNFEIGVMFYLAIKLLLAYFLIGIGGYFLNDLFDKQKDKLVNKFNITTILNEYLIIVMIIALWGIGYYLVYSISFLASLMIFVLFLAL